MIKPVMNSWYKYFRMVVITNCLLFLAMISIPSCQNHMGEPLHTVFTIPDFGTISSICLINHDTLVVGTEQGNLYFYRPDYDNNPIKKIDSIGKRSVYCIYPYKNDLFVGISDDGLKLYSKTGDCKCHYHLGQRNGNKNYYYSVYGVSIDRDTLFCATSSGLAMLDLKSSDIDSLQLLYPESTPTLPDCKYNNVWLFGDTLKALSNDSLLSFVRGRYDSIVWKAPCTMDKLKENTVTLSDITYKFKQGENKFYAYSTDTIVPYNVSLVRLQANFKDSLIVITEENASKKDVFIGAVEGVKWDRKWSNTLSRDIPVEEHVKDAIFFPNNKCLILTNQERIFEGNRHHLKPLKFKSNLSKMTDRSKCIFYSKELQTMFVALGSGYVTYPLDENGYPIWEIECFHDTTIAVRSFANYQDTLYVGTLHNGCIVKDPESKIIRILPHNDICDIKVVNGTCFILSNNSLIIDDSIKCHNILKLYPYTNGVIGSTDKHICSFDTDGNIDTFPFHPVFGQINPSSLFVAGNHLFVGTNKGLVVSKIDYTGQENKKTFVPFILPFWKTHDIWLFFFVFIIITVLISAVSLKIEKEKLKKQKVENLLNHPYMKILPNEIDSNDTGSTDWVTQNAAEYKNKYENLKEMINNADFSTDIAVEHLQKEIEDTLLQYTFAMELYNLRHNMCITIDSEKKKWKELYQKIDNLTILYLEKIVTFDENTNQHQRDKKYFFHLWILALLSVKDEKDKDEKKMYINTPFLTKYIQPFRNTIFNYKPDFAKYQLRKAISERTLFFPKEQKSELFSDLTNDLIIKIGDHKNYKTSENKKVFLNNLKKSLKTDLNDNMTNPTIWERVIDNIKIQNKHYGRVTKEKTFVVLDGKTITEWKVSSSNTETQLVKEVTDKDLLDKEIRIVWNNSDYYEILKELFEKTEKTTIRNKIKELHETFRDFLLEKKPKETNQKWLKKLLYFYNNYFSRLFKQPTNNKEGYYGALQIWVWYIVANGNPTWNESKNKENLLLKFLQGIQDKENKNKRDINENIDDWKKLLAEFISNESSDIKPKDKYKDLVNEWKEATRNMESFVNQSKSS